MLLYCIAVESCSELGPAVELACFGIVICVVVGFFEVNQSQSRANGRGLVSAEGATGYVVGNKTSLLIDW